MRFTLATIAFVATFYASSASPISSENPDSSSTIPPSKVAQCQAQWTTCRNSCSEGDSVCGMKCLGDYEKCTGLTTKDAAATATSTDSTADTVQARSPKATTIAECDAQATKCNKSCKAGDNGCTIGCWGASVTCKENVDGGSNTVAARSPKATTMAECDAQATKCNEGCKAGDNGCITGCWGAALKCKYAVDDATSTVQARSPKATTFAQCDAQATKCNESCKPGDNGCIIGCNGAAIKCKENASGGSAVEARSPKATTIAQCDAQATKCNKSCKAGDNGCTIGCWGASVTCKENVDSASNTVEARSPKATTIAQCDAQATKCNKSCKAGDNGCTIGCWGAAVTCKENVGN